MNVTREQIYGGGGRARVASDSTPFFKNLECTVVSKTIRIETSLQNRGILKKKKERRILREKREGCSSTKLCRTIPAR